MLLQQLSKGCTRKLQEHRERLGLSELTCFEEAFPQGGVLPDATRQGLSEEFDHEFA
jgi:hypothetical protein